MFAILCYHKTGPETQEGRNLNTSPEKLDAQIKFLRRRGFCFVQAGSLADKIPERGVCLAFDDAYQSFAQLGAPVLASNEVTGSTYVVTGLVGQQSSWDGEKARPLATWDEIREIARLGIEIGNHSKSHADFSDIDGDAQRQEIIEAARELQTKGFPLQSFCLPYGKFGPETIELVRLCGYPVCLTLEKGVVPRVYDPGRLPRVTMAFSDGVAGLMYKLWVRPRLTF